VWFENGTEKARKQRNENSKRLIKSVFWGNADKKTLKHEPCRSPSRPFSLYKKAHNHEIAVKITAMNLLPIRPWSEILVR